MDEEDKEIEERIKKAAEGVSEAQKKLQATLDDLKRKNDETRKAMNPSPTPPKK